MDNVDKMANDADAAVKWTEMYIPYNLHDDETSSDSDSDSNERTHFSGSLLDRNSNSTNIEYTYDNPQRQHLHLFRNNNNAKSNQPSPVLFYSHPSGRLAKDLDQRSLEIIASTGYSVISWESVTLLGNHRAILTCWEDFDTVWSWFLEKAAVYNLDPHNGVVIGGSSRGTMCSWPLAHSPTNNAIQGIYMYDAIPTSFWEEAVTPSSPRAHLLYGQECPKPIAPDCEPRPDPDTIHNPSYGQRIVDKYTALGIEPKIKLTDGLKNRNLTRFDFFPEFVASLSSPPVMDSQEVTVWKNDPKLLYWFTVVGLCGVVGAAFGVRCCKQAWVLQNRE